MDLDTHQHSWSAQEKDFIKGGRLGEGVGHRGGRWGDMGEKRKGTN